VLEGVIVPSFRPGRFDQLAESSSPFNIGALPSVSCSAEAAGCVTLVPSRHTPKARFGNVSGGSRLTASLGRVDVGGSVYRGYEPFPQLTLGPQLPSLVADPPVFVVFEEFPRFTMIAADFETTHGPWGLRGEAAYFPEDTLQSVAPLAAVPGRTLEIGVGGDRTAGDYRVSGNVITTRRRIDLAEWRRAPVPYDANIEDTEVLMVGWAERRFSRDTRVVRMLAAYNPPAGSVFVRGIAAFNLRDNVWVEGSAGWLRGDGLDVLSRLSMRDFIYTRLRLHF
jgi:hypothetical protein